MGDDDEHTQITLENKRNARLEKKEKGRSRQGREIRNSKKMGAKYRLEEEKKRERLKMKKKYKGKESIKEQIKQKKYYSKKKKFNQKGKKPNNKKHKKQKPTNQKQITKKPSRKPAKFGSDIYGSKAIEVIKSENKTKPFFIYLALLTKSYPRDVLKRRGGNMEEAIAENRRKKLLEMDESVKQIVKALKTSGQYSNTVIFFISDNGARAVGEPENTNNPNYPLRGSKGTIYEGGTKVPAFIHNPLMKSENKR